MFTLKREALTDRETKVLEKLTDFVSIQLKIRQPELKRHFKELCLRMRLKGCYRNEVTPDFSDPPSFPPATHPNLQVFISQPALIYKYL